MVAGSDVAISDAAAIHVRRVDGTAGHRGAPRPHRRAGAGATNGEPAGLALIDRSIVHRHARGRVGIQRYVRRRAFAATADLRILVEISLRRCGRLVSTAPATATAPAGFTGEIS